ncbi:MAG TPA: hypothetical protein VG963_32585 [Polyangiaceae bacterium]|nr:hypothetical protein [Polyangiaceae bacterium]
MGTITILNGTNAPINSCISAGLNYSWCNLLGPQEYYSHEGGPGGVFTLNTRYWFGTESEYARSSALEIVSFVGGTVLGVVGLVLTFASGGAATPIIAAAMMGSGVVTGVGGLALGALGVASHEFTTSPQNWTNIQAAQNRRFIAEGALQGKEDKGNKTFQITGSSLTLRELSDEEFKRKINSGFIEHPRDPSHAQRIVGACLTHAELQESLRFDGVLNNLGSLFPRRGGEACWEIEDDGEREGQPMQLWSRPNAPQVVWKIQAEQETATGQRSDNLFSIYNPELKRYATLQGDSIVAKSKQTSKDARALQLFRIVGLPRSGKNTLRDYAFVPSTNPALVIIPEDGNNGNSTKLKTGSITGPHPIWARWVVSNRPAGLPPA